MFRLTFQIFVLVSLSIVVAVHSDQTDICTDLRKQQVDCILNTKNITLDERNNTESCNECATNGKFFERIDRTSCAATNDWVCDYFHTCFDACGGNQYVCREENFAYSVCFFGTLYGPDGCLATCDGGINGGGDQLRDGDDNGSGRGSASSGPSTIAISAALHAGVAVMGVVVVTTGFVL